MQMSQTGLTIIELLLSLVVMALLAMLALPHFQSLAQQTRVRGAGSLVYTHLQLARSEAIKRNASITICFSGSGTVAWQYKVLELSQAGDCDSQVIDEIEQVNGQQFLGVILTAAYPSPHLIFKPRRSTLLSGSFTLSQDSHSLKVITWNNSIIRTCSESQLLGVPPC
ncbi:GspH/FimT family pseudopilin [Oceanisphaera sp. W20_SRM_FM3]|uniref:GspH/FimT family pseudopilin n=1 Tax=Oceanisphaera sp. W20_SRM_FM3 TaxID=3240267 RepID=UPI003F94FCF8